MISIDNIKRIEKMAYPDGYVMFSYMDDIEDLSTEYCDDDEYLDILSAKDSYMIITISKNKNKMYIVDYASLNPIGGSGIIKQFLKKYKGYKVSCDARKSTSYPILKKLHKKKLIKIRLDVKSEEFDDERYVVFKVK